MAKKKTAQGNAFISFTLFFIQILLFVFLVLLIIPPVKGITIVLCTAGFLIGLWALLVMRKSKLNALPDVMAGAVLVTNGPYMYIRHPMYDALLLIALGSVLNEPNPLRLGLFIGLVLVLLLKINYEESILLTVFPKYKTYKQKTKRLIPGIW